MDRDDALDAFLAVVNTATPDHPYYRDPYPLDRGDVKFGTTRSYYARCGPKQGRRKAVYKTRMTYINGLDRTRHLALLTHEITHLVVGYHNGRGASGHPPAFWREMAFHALELRDAMHAGVLEPVFGDIDADAYLEAVASDPRKSTVDRRYWSVEECRSEMADLVGTA